MTPEPPKPRRKPNLLTPLENRRLELKLREQAKHPKLSPESRRQSLISAGNLKQIRLHLAKRSG